MGTVLGWVVFIIGVNISVALHELGHMIPAKRFGVRVPQYMIGFGPTLWSRKRGETEYGIKAVAVGGYVRLVGMIPPAGEVKPVRGTGWAAKVIEESRAASVEEMQPGDEPRAFYRLTWWRRVIVMAGGTGANLLIALVLLTGIGVFYGSVTDPGIATATIHQVLPCVLPAGEDRACTPADPVSAAAAAGLEVGDSVVSVNGTPVTGLDQLVNYLRARPGETVTLGVERDGEHVAIVAHLASSVRPLYDDAGNPVLDAAGKQVSGPVGFLGATATEVPAPAGPFYGITATAHDAVATGGAILQLPQKV